MALSLPLRLKTPFDALRSLPRDSRDTLFLLVVVGWVVLPQLGNLPLWCSTLTGVVLLWRGYLALAGRPLPGKWWLLGLLALTIAATWYSHRTLLGRDAGVTLTVVLLALKTLELRARRDAFVIFFLGFFTMLTNFFFSQSLLTAAAMLVALLGLLTALVNAHMPVGRPPLLQAARTAGWMALLGAPIMAVLFLLFPRMAPLWGLPGDSMSGRSGLSATMQVGSIAQLVLDDSIAMRIRFDGTVPPQQDLYFRGPVLATFDGREWRGLASGFPRHQQAQADLQVAGTPFSYEVTLEPNQRPWIFVLEAAARAPAVPGHDIRMTADLQWLSTRPVTDLVRYSAQSYSSFRHGPQRQTLQLQDYTDLPAGFNPRTLALAAEMRRDPQLTGATADGLARAVLDRLRSGGYVYTLEPGTTGTHSADEFWFDSKAGFCEHIASAFVVLMRALDVPARIVTGYQGGDRNSVDGFWTVRQSDAHAWAEIWQAGRGWVRIDPTAAVAPSRTGALQRLLPPRGALASAFNDALGTISPGLLSSLRAGWEALNNGWNQWVLNYSQGRQFNLLRQLGFAEPSWQDLSYLLLGILVLASLAGAGWARWERSQHDPWLRLLERARHRLAQAGLPMPPASPPRAMAQQAQQHFGAAAEPLAAWLLALESHRYAVLPGTPLATLRRDFHHLRWPD